MVLLFYGIGGIEIGAGTILREIALAGAAGETGSSGLVLGFGVTVAVST